MHTTGPNRIDANLARNRAYRGGSESSSGLALTQIVAGVMENWGDIEQDLPWNQPAGTDREPVRREAARAARKQQPTPRSERLREPESPEVTAESEELTLPGLAHGDPLKPIKPETPAQNSENHPSEPEPAQQALAWRAPEMPKIAGAPVPASFAVPNHSAGASGFGNTWSHAAKTAKPDDIILSE